ncbi:OprO/OprP family phosphate-selective porin [Bremerella cremea]|uniref:OprO/OprP family phosphate-selective porin n=1 Tax=Bremerella cremea TaxID=1031537 RepID=UPI0031E72BDB
MKRWIVIATVVMVSYCHTAMAQYEFAGPTYYPTPLPPPPTAEMITADQAAALQAQIDELKRELNRSKFETPAMNVSAPGSAAPDLIGDVDALMKWRKSVEKAEAAAAAKAALKPSVNVGGRVFIDSAVFGQNDESMDQVGDAENAMKVRWAWVELKGNMLENTEYRLWFDLAGQVSLLDVYLDFGELPYIQNFRVGHFFEPWGMEQLTPNKYLTTMERASPFNLGRNMGIMAHSNNDEANWTYGVGLFVSEVGSKPPFYQNDNDSSAITGRVTYLPWYDEASGGRGLIHVGAGYSWRHLGDGTAQFQNRPDSALAPIIVDTGVINADSYQQLELEAAYAYGSFILQSEYHIASIDTDDFGSEALNHYYIQASYVLTGENRAYNRKSGSFANRVVPYENFFRVRTEDNYICNGWGAWELAYRFAHDDLNSDNIFGGRDHRHLVGLNWYLSPFSRAMFEYVYSNTEDQVASDGVLQIFQMRMQYDF